MIKSYYELAKPGIIYGNILTAAAGFFLASRGIVHWSLFVAMILGLSFVIGAACVFNNCIDRDIDGEMERTKTRATVTGDISNTAAIGYGSVLLVIGNALLFFFTNLLTLAVALVGVISYVALYTPLKRKTVHSTLVGSIAGAVPPVVGFCAVTNMLNAEALILFLILVFWQMPHFYAIALYRKDEYASASVPVLPIKKGSRTTKMYILLYIICFVAASLSLSFFGFTNRIYFAVMLALGLVWLYFALQGFSRKIKDEKIWARKVFLFSLIVILCFSIFASFGTMIP